MKRTFHHLVGILIILASIAGLVISIGGVFGVWSLERSLLRETQNTLALIDTTLSTTADGIRLASGSIEQAAASLDSVIGTLETTGKSVADSAPLIESLSQVTTESIPQTISSTQTALLSAQSSAKVIDTTLVLLTSIPFLPVQPYANQPPLAESLRLVSESLDPIASSLLAMDESLKQSQANLAAIQVQFAQIVQGLRAIQTNLEQAKGITGQYLDVVTSLQKQVQTTRQRLPGALQNLAWFLTIFLAWLGLTQIGLLMQGLEMLGLEFPPRKTPIEPTSADSGPPQTGDSANTR